MSKRSHSFLRLLTESGLFALELFVGINLFVIVDMEYPRQGFIRVDAFDQVLVDLRQSMK